MSDGAQTMWKVDVKADLIGHLWKVKLLGDASRHLIVKPCPTRNAYKFSTCPYRERSFIHSQVLVSVYHAPINTNTNTESSALDYWKEATIPMSHADPMSPLAPEANVTPSSVHFGQPETA
uniref:Uncharacterized protein n=1 Tax=Psilocybe cubensis TaxID=181762 RepID=A0A8H7Y5X7_PSICU